MKSDNLIVLLKQISVSHLQSFLSHFQHLEVVVVTKGKDSNQIGLPINTPTSKQSLSKWKRISWYILFHGSERSMWRTTERGNKRTFLCWLTSKYSSKNEIYFHSMLCLISASRLAYMGELSKQILRSCFCINSVKFFHGQSCTSH